jgi:hypothetical protein
MASDVTPIKANAISLVLMSNLLSGCEWMM